MGSRRAGRNGRIYVGLANAAAAATPLLFQTRWSLDSKTARYDATAFGDANITYVAGLPDAQGSYDGFLDSDGQDTWAASQDGAARKFYLYPDITNDAGDYWFGTAFFDFSVETPVGGVITAKGTFSAASPVIRVNA